MASSYSSPASTVPYLLNVFIYLALAGSVVALFMQSGVSSDGLSGPAVASLWGYGTIGVALMGTIYLALGAGMRAAGTSGFKAFVMESLPATASLAIVVWAVALNILYFKPINRGFVTPTYNGLSKLLAAMLIASAGTSMYGLKQNIENESSQIGNVAYLFSVYGGLVLIMMNISLAFFSTQG